MARVLISFLGTGPFEDKSERKYKNALYRIDDKEYETPFISAALSEHFQIEKRIVIGTAKSMWEAYYMHFAKDFSVNKYNEIIEYTDNANSLSDDFELIEGLEDQLVGTKIVVLKYGLTESELRENIIKVLRIEDFLNKKDGIYMDMTHGFRSFPLLAHQIFLYLKEVSSKNLKPRKFFYGMLDASRDLGYTPIVDLSIMLEMNEWIIGANQFKSGNYPDILYKLLIKKNAELAKTIDEFSKAININYSYEIRQQLEKLNNFDTSTIENPEKLIIDKVIADFVSNFSKTSRHSIFQYELARWFFTKHNYSNAFIVLAESVLSLFCEKKGLNSLIKSNRDQSKDQIHKDKDLYNIYKKVQQSRNNIAHHLNKRPGMYLEDIDEFTTYTMLLKKHFK